MTRVWIALLAAALAAAPAAGQPARTISFGIVSANPDYWAIFAARDGGLYDRHGVRLDLVFTGSSAAATQALTGGSLHMTVSATDAAFIAQQKVPEMRQIYSLVGRLPYSLMVTPDIERVEDLRGASPFGRRLGGCVLGLAMAVTGTAGRAGELEDACELATRQLRSVPSGSLRRSTAHFEYEGRSYRGCIVRLEGSRERVVDAHAPASLLYPSAGSALHAGGWRVDREADGPDGTAFRISRQDVFCLVEGRWDGGDDSDPKGVPSSRYELEVRCGSSE